MKTIAHSTIGSLYCSVILTFLLVVSSWASPANIRFVKPIVIVNEAARFAVISVERTAPDANLFSVVFETADGTAIAGEDYVQTSGTLTFAPRQRFKTFKV